MTAMSEGDAVVEKINFGRLTWDDKVANLSWPEADSYCKSKGMRLPTKDELDETYKQNKEAFKNPSGTYWASDKYPTTSSFTVYFTFYNGSLKSGYEPNKNFVRCVIENK